MHWKMDRFVSIIRVESLNQYMDLQMNEGAYNFYHSLKYVESIGAIAF